MLFKSIRSDWQYGIQVALFMMLIGFPFLGAWLPHPIVGFDILFIVFLVYSIILLESPSLLLLVTGIIALLMMSIQLTTRVEFSEITPWRLKLEWMLMVCFFLLMGYRLAVDTFSTGISMRLLYICIVNYMNIGLLFSFLYRIEHFHNPIAFNFSHTQPYNYIYMSIVVLTGVGLGDMLPETNSAKSLLVVEALAGQLYLTVFVGVIIGKYLAEKGKT